MASAGRSLAGTSLGGCCKPPAIAEDVPFVPGCRPAVSPSLPSGGPGGEMMFSTPPFQGSGFLGCSRAPLPRQFPAGAAAPTLISEHPPGVQHPGAGARCKAPALLGRPSVSLPKSKGFWCVPCHSGRRAVLGAPLAVPSLSRYSGVSGVSDAGGAQLSPPLPARQRLSAREAFFGTQPLAPRRDSVTRPRRRRGQGWPWRRFAALLKPGIPVRAPVG